MRVVCENRKVTSRASWGFASRPQLAMHAVIQRRTLRAHVTNLCYGCLACCVAKYRLLVEKFTCGLGPYLRGIFAWRLRHNWLENITRRALWRDLRSNGQSCGFEQCLSGIGHDSRSARSELAADCVQLPQVWRLRRWQSGSLITVEALVACVVRACVFLLLLLGLTLRCC